ncbi:CLUMA_CG019244, isoform A [Clunio marinus]|uniref:CLUMA_CG019244, isoform A n=1 Tax=Clunio marinus TaxID=568069 RepID=A0A1J1J3T4_9DIPT|nr:CLUMA_CG019244, isoform A [Clunio marinus]
MLSKTFKEKISLLKGKNEQEKEEEGKKNNEMMNVMNALLLQNENYLTCEMCVGYHNVAALLADALSASMSVVS